MKLPLILFTALFTLAGCEVSDSSDSDGRTVDDYTSIADYQEGDIRTGSWVDSGTSYFGAYTFASGALSSVPVDSDSVLLFWESGYDPTTHVAGFAGVKPGSAGAANALLIVQNELLDALGEDEELWVEERHVVDLGGYDAYRVRFSLDTNTWTDTMAMGRALYRLAATSVSPNRSVALPPSNPSDPTYKAFAIECTAADFYLGDTVVMCAVTNAASRAANNAAMAAMTSLENVYP